MKYRKARRRIMTLCAVLLTLSMTLCAYGEDEYYDFRDDMINLILPDDWDVTEIAPEDSEGEIAEQILTAQEEDAKQPIRLDVYFSYSALDDDEYFYFHGDEEEAMEYYSLYGEDAVEDFYENEAMESAYGEISYGDPEFFDGEWIGFLKMPVTVKLDTDGGTKSRSDMVYLTASTTENNGYVVHKMLIFSNDSAAAFDDQASGTIEKIADGFFDYGYDTQMTGDERPMVLYEEDDYNIEDAVGQIILSLLPLAIIVVVGGAAVRILLKRKGVNQSGYANNINASAKRTYGQKTRPPQQRRQTVNINTAAAGSGDVEKGYMESLKTLYKSGLLTKAEMNEMIEKHQARYRRK